MCVYVRERESVCERERVHVCVYNEMKVIERISYRW